MNPASLDFLRSMESMVSRIIEELNRSLPNGKMKTDAIENCRQVLINAALGVADCEAKERQEASGASRH